MASIREAAQNVISEGRDGIGWIALWKHGRGWETAAFWPDYNERANTLAFETYDMPEIIEILEQDPDAIIVNSYVHNLGSVEEMTRDTLANALRWQYDLQNSKIADYLQEDVLRQTTTQHSDKPATKHHKGSRATIKVKIEAMQMARLSKGWSRKKLAAEAGVTPQTIGRIERGLSASPEIAKKIADALEANTTDLFTIG